MPSEYLFSTLKEVLDDACANIWRRGSEATESRVDSEGPGDALKVHTVSERCYFKAAYGSMTLKK